MGPEEATDVVKALAAFGAPSIRYHSFGQGQAKPSSTVLPHSGPAASAAAFPDGPAMLAPVVPPLAPRPVEAAPRPAPPLGTAQPGTMQLEAAQPSAALRPPAPMPLIPMPPVPAFRRTLGPAAPRPAELRPAPAVAAPPPAPGVAWPVGGGVQAAGQGRPLAPESAPRPPAPPGPAFAGVAASPAQEIPAGHSLPEIFAFLASTSAPGNPSPRP